MRIVDYGKTQLMFSEGKIKSKTIDLINQDNKLAY